MRNLELSQETAKRWYEGTDEELKGLALQTYPELGKNKLPITWNGLEQVNGYYINNDSIIYKDCGYVNDRNRNFFATKEQAEALIALAQLSQLREVYRNGWIPDWSKDENKFVIILRDGMIIDDTNIKYNKFLSFQDRETRDLFLKNFRDLIEKAKPLMS
ncbi:hypothetical protein [Flavobacterium sp.]|uniref:hypothetical protein n=1 Tax=Flavobacterium sp. TaxID=239 RepID=UPI0025FA3785|nr:hypothetical protein [Flavobacterium sp.]